MASWAEAHLDELRRRVDALTEAAEKARGKARVAINEEIEQLERRAARAAREMAREAALTVRANAAAAAEERARVKAGESAWARAQRLMKSKNPRDTAELIVGAAAELPVTLEMEVGEAIVLHAKERSGHDPVG